MAGTNIFAFETDAFGKRVQALLEPLRVILETFRKHKKTPSAVKDRVQILLAQHALHADFTVAVSSEDGEVGVTLVPVSDVAKKWQANQK